MTRWQLSCSFVWISLFSLPGIPGCGRIRTPHAHVEFCFGFYSARKHVPCSPEMDGHERHPPQWFTDKCCLVWWVNYPRKEVRSICASEPSEHCGWGVLLEDRRQATSRKTASDLIHKLFRTTNEHVPGRHEPLNSNLGASLLPWMTNEYERIHHWKLKPCLESLGSAWSEFWFWWDPVQVLKPGPNPGCIWNQKQKLNWAWLQKAVHRLAPAKSSNPPIRTVSPWSSYFGHDTRTSIFNSFLQ